jgi:hypothetical protein
MALLVMRLTSIATRREWLGLRTKVRPRLHPRIWWLEVLWLLARLVAALVLWLALVACDWTRLMVVRLVVFEASFRATFVLRPALAAR